MCTTAAWSTFTLLCCHAAAKSLQSCPILCDPIDGSPPGSPIPGILQARTLEWVAIAFSSEWKWKVKSLLATPWTAAHQAPPSMGFSRQEHWSGVPSPSLCAAIAASKELLSSCKMETLYPLNTDFPLPPLPRLWQSAFYFLSCERACPRYVLRYVTEVEPYSICLLWLLYFT